MSDSSVLYETADGVATLTLNRPDAMNSLTAPMKTALLSALSRAAGDVTARAILLTGQGRAFCAGQDLREHAENLDAGRGLAGTVESHYNPLVKAIVGLEKPVIAAVNGVAAGAGASLAFACDLRVAATKASFVMAFAQVGLAPDTGASWTLQRLVGQARAREMLLLASPVAAEEALRIGLVNTVADDAAAAGRELAVRLARGPTRAYAAIKQALDYAATHSLDESLELEAALQDKCAATADHVNATRAFLKKEQPVFDGH